MGLDKLIKRSVATASRLTRSLQVLVAHTPAATVASDGTMTGAATVNRRALVEQNVRRFQVEGVVVVSRAKITFLENVSIAESDRLVLPDGFTGPILAVEKMLAPGGGGYVTTVWLGAR